MSWYTIFDEQETLVTSTTTARIVSASDPVLGHSAASGGKYQSTVGQFSQVAPVTAATSNTTATNILPYGLTKVTATSSFAWLLLDPPATGLIKSFLNTTTTSTNNVINTVTATIISTLAAAGTSLQMQAGVATVTLTSLSTSQWGIVSKSGTVSST